MTTASRVDIDKPRYDQSTYINRAKHFFLLTNPLNLLASRKQLAEARCIVLNYRANKRMPNLTEEQLWRAKYLYDSAFHPETGEKQILIGRMSAQVPMNTFITGCMLAFYKSTPAVVFWQWFNQTFNAIVNYTNRSGVSHITKPQLFTAYVLATSGALSTALTLNRLVKNIHPLIGRLVPLMAIAAGNCINIPVMRFQELKNGIVLLNEKNDEVGKSRKAAAVGIASVVASRIAMGVPGMVLTPVLMEYLQKKGFLQRYPRSNVPIQTLSCGFFVTFTTPLACAFFSQRASMKVSSLEKIVQEDIKIKYPDLTRVWFNKGL